MILSGFDYTTSGVLARSGQELAFSYGEIVAPGHPTQIRDTSTGATAPVIDGKYFLLITPMTGQAGLGINTHLVALDSAGAIVADEKKPLPGTPTIKCVGRYNVRRESVPGTKRTTLIWSCRHYVPTIAK